MNKKIIMKFIKKTKNIIFPTVLVLTLIGIYYAGCHREYFRHIAFILAILNLISLEADSYVNNLLIKVQEELISIQNKAIDKKFKEQDKLKVENERLKYEIRDFEDGFKGACPTCENVGEVNKDLEIEVNNLKKELKLYKNTNKI